MFADHYAIVTGVPFRGVPHSDAKRVVPLVRTSDGPNADRDPWLLLDRIERAMKPAVGGRTVHLKGRGIDAHAALWHLTALVGADMKLSLLPYFGSESSSVHVDPDDYLAGDASLLRGTTIASGVASESTIASRVATALKLE
jgi:hypothetical protein